jgi:ergothioneine biosynthesis protein EgtB
MAASTTTRDQLHQRFTEVRRFTDALSQPLSAEDCAIQSMPEASPTKWHLAHTSWFFENFVLLALGEAPFHPRYGFLFNSYYEAEGPRQERPKRGLLSRPSLDEVRRYRADVDRRVRRALREMSDERFAALGSVIELGLHHEQQHQELLLTDILHALAGSPLRPAYREGAPPRSPADASDPGPMGWIAYAAGVREVGHDGAGFAFDNEAPRHAVYQSAYLLADRLVTCGEYLGFIEDGGYRRPDLWLSDGWEAVKAERWSMPLYWARQGSSFEAASLDGVRPVDPSEPVCHLSYYEADAYARWAGARLPTEAEWEIAAASAPLRGTFADGLALHPQPAPPRVRELAHPRQLFGEVWQWTASAYSSYPGFRPLSGALGEYNGKFMCNQLVLRGGSCATPASHLRASYRNFFPPSARWQFSGVRLARDA